MKKKKKIYDCFGGCYIDYNDLVYFAEYGVTASGSFASAPIFRDCGTEVLRNAVFYQLYQMNGRVECVKSGIDYIWEDITVEEASKRQVEKDAVLAARKANRF